MDSRKRKVKEVDDGSLSLGEVSKPTLRTRAKQKKVNYAIDNSDSEESEIELSKPAKKTKNSKKNTKNSKKTKKTIKSKATKNKKAGHSSDSDFEFDGHFEESDEKMSSLSESENAESGIQSEASSVIISRKGTKRNTKGKTKDKSSGATNDGPRPMHTKNFIPSTVRASEETKINADAGTSINDMGGLEDVANLEIPQFIKKDMIKDKNMRRPTDPLYDPSSVHIPKDQFEKLSPLMKQYWGVKSKYYDSIVFVRMAQWYTVFYYDIIALNLLSNSHLKLSACMEGFYGTQKEKYIKLFTDNNYRVVVTEQTENVSWSIQALDAYAT